MIAYHNSSVEWENFRIVLPAQDKSCPTVFPISEINSQTQSAHGAAFPMMSLMQFMILKGLVMLHLVTAAVMSLKHVPANEQSDGNSEMNENV